MPFDTAFAPAEGERSRDAWSRGTAAPRLALITLAAMPPRRRAGTCRKNRNFATRFVDVSPAATYTADVSQKRFSDNTRKTARWHADRPYNGLARLPPRSDIESKAVLRQC